MSGVHLFIFCANRYKDTFLDACVLSIDRYINDKILSYNIVTDKKFTYEGFNVIEDNDIWNVIDPQFKYKPLYDNNWIKQQIIKLSLDKICKNNILVVDADLFFLKPVTFVENNKHNFYMADEYVTLYFQTADYLCDVKKQTEKSFISDFIIFDESVLGEIKTSIEKNHDEYWVKVINDYIKIVLKDEQCLKKGLSEYELYGNYLIQNNPEKVNNLVYPIDYQMWVHTFPDDFNCSPEKFLENISLRSNNYYQSVWL